MPLQTIIPSKTISSRQRKKIEIFNVISFVMSSENLTYLIIHLMDDIRPFPKRIQRTKDTGAITKLS